MRGLLYASTGAAASGGPALLPLIQMSAELRLSLGLR